MAYSDPVVVHWAAYNQKKVLHRDISTGNVFIVNNRATLGDWELSVELSTKGPTRSHRTVSGILKHR